MGLKLGPSSLMMFDYIQAGCSCDKRLSEQVQRTKNFKCLIFLSRKTKLKLERVTMELLESRAYIRTKDIMLGFVHKKKKNKITLREILLQNKKNRGKVNVLTLIVWKYHKRIPICMWYVVLLWSSKAKIDLQLHFFTVIFQIQSCLNDQAKGFFYVLGGFKLTSFSLQVTIRNPQADFLLSI